MSNTLIFIGRLGKDAERKQANGKTFLKFSAGETVGYGDNKTTNWWNCTVFGKQAESSLIDYLSKGAQVKIVGEVKFREYDGKIYNDVAVQNIELVGSRDTQAQKPQQPQQGGFNQQPQNNSSQNNDLDDDLPF